MLNIFLSAAISFVITCLAIPAIIRVAEEKKLYDLPDERKLHTKHIASLGGVGIFIGFILSTLLSIYKNNPEFQYFFASAIVIFFLGLKDDILILSARKKFLGQLAATAIIIHLGNIRIEGMYGLFGVEKLPEIISILLTYITIIVVVNAFNLIDGVDGLAGGLGFFTTVLFGSYFLMAGMPVYSILAFAMAGSLLAFLIFNFHPARIFMGDSGSLLIGLINAILVIKFITVAHSPVSAIHLDSSVAIGFSILLLPLLDTLRVFSIRIAKGKSPFCPDRTHIHHLLLDRGLNHRAVTLICIAYNLSFVGLAWFGRSLGSTWLLTIMFISSFSILGALLYFRRLPSQFIITNTFQQNIEPTVAPARKLVTIKNEPVIVEAVSQEN
ncbi:MAG: glycosyltransferase family 4 protein [Flavisolibacter sp.]|jgi:UDP-GlcNAc:undecaprenyl-phosphate GlcNAc-1-phosphate transferase